MHTPPKKINFKFVAEALPSPPNLQTQTQPKATPSPLQLAPNSRLPSRYILRRPTLCLVTSLVLPEGRAGTNWESQGGSVLIAPVEAVSAAAPPASRPPPSLSLSPNKGGTPCYSRYSLLT